MELPFPFGIEITSKGVVKCPTPYPQRTEKEAGPRDKAKSLLCESLKGGRQKQTVLEAAARKAGISDKTLNRAKTELHIQSKKQGSTWFWELPPKQGAQKTTAKKK